MHPSDVTHEKRNQAAIFSHAFVDFCSLDTFVLATNHPTEMANVKSAFFFLSFCSVIVIDYLDGIKKKTITALYYSDKYRTFPPLIISFIILPIIRNLLLSCIVLLAREVVIKGRANCNPIPPETKLVEIRPIK